MDEKELALAEDLSLRLADGVLSESDANDLERLLEADPGAVRSYQGLLDLEACLRAGRENLDLVNQAMARLGAVLEEQITRGSMERILSGPSPKWKIESSPPERAPQMAPGQDRNAPRAAGPSPRLRIAAVVLLTLAVVGTLVMLLERSWQGPPLGSMVTSTPGVVVARGGATMEARSGDRLAPGDSVQVPPGGAARIRLGEDVVLDLGPATSVTLAGPSREARLHGEDRARLIVSEGTVTARVSRNRASGALVLATPHAEMSTTSGEWVVSVRPESTVLEAREGHARVRRVVDNAGLEMTPGFFVLASPSAPLVARPIPDARRRHPDVVPPDHTPPPDLPQATPHGHDPGFHPELKQHGEQRRTP